jgi:hypothetical protein
MDSHERVKTVLWTIDRTKSGIKTFRPDCVLGIRLRHDRNGSGGVVWSFDRGAEFLLEHLAMVEIRTQAEGNGSLQPTQLDGAYGWLLTGQNKS